MFRTLTAAIVASAALAAPAFAMDNPVPESRAKIERALGGDTAKTATGGQVSVNRTESDRRTFDVRVLSPDSSWRGNYRGGRANPPAGR